MKYLVVLLLVAILIVIGLSFGQANNCLTVPDGPWLYYSRYIHYYIVDEGLTGECWYTNRTGSEHERACNYIYELDPTAGTCYNFEPTPTAPFSPLDNPEYEYFFPIIVKGSY